jgi:AraC family transcriptional regulator, positive regulator of tynA and feaB
LPKHTPRSSIAPGLGIKIHQTHMLAINDRLARQRWCTGDVNARHALAYWADTICKSFLEIDIDTPDRKGFRGQLDQTELGPAMLYVVEADTQAIRRTPVRIAHSRYPGYILMQLRAGRARYKQYGRECFLDTGDSLLVDCTAPYQLESLAATRSVAVRFPQDWLKNWIPAPERLAARSLQAGFGWNTALCAALANLETAFIEELALPRSVVAEQIAGLLALAAGPDARVAAPSEKLFKRIQQTIHDRYPEPGLSPGDVAKDNGISTRYLHYLCAHAATTFGEQLMRRRLESAQRLLNDRRYDALSVSEVAARCGFLEPSHFARRFRKAYGSGPTEFRALRSR